MSPKEIEERIWRVAATLAKEIGREGINESLHLLANMASRCALLIIYESDLPSPTLREKYKFRFATTVVQSLNPEYSADLEHGARAREAEDEASRQTTTETEAILRKVQERTSGTNVSPLSGTSPRRPGRPRQAKRTPPNG